MPRALTEKEKALVKEKILEEAKLLIKSYGVKKMSIQDITNACSLSKGLFYHYFKSKEELIYELVVDMHQQLFTQAMLFFKANIHNDLRHIIKEFLIGLLDSNNQIILFKFQEEIHDFLEVYTQEKYQENFDLEAYEIDSYKKLLTMINVNLSKVKPEIVSNMVHSLLLIKSDLYTMKAKYIEQTLNLLIDVLVDYIIKGIE